MEIPVPAGLESAVVGGKDDKEDPFAAEPIMELTPQTPNNPNGTASINLEPFIGMEFQSEVEAYQLYNEYSKQIGFGIRKKLCRRSKANNDVIAGWYVCSRQGVYLRPANTAHPRVGCSAKLKVKRIAINKWQVTEFIRDHNHELTPKSASLFRSHRKAYSVRTDLIEIVSRNARLRENAGRALDDEEQKHSFFSAADAHAHHMYFMGMRSKSPTFSYAMHLDKEQRVRAAFWADAMSKAAYSYFGDVVMLDTTYLSGRYKLPLVTFVGANHHGQPILLGCSLLADEVMASYKWLFETWLEAMSRQPPNALITERSKSISAAIAMVFPEARHRICLWHVLKSVSEKLGYVYRAQDSFMKKFYKCIYDSMTGDVFEKRWWKFVHHFGLINDEWLQSLYDERRQWALVYVKDTFFAGMSISRYGESLSSIFDKYVSRNTNLKEFLEKYELIVANRFEEEAQEDIQSFHLMLEERTNPSPFEFQMSNVYTTSIFEKFKAEILGISSVFPSKIGEDGESIIYSVKVYDMQEYNVDKKVKEKEYRVVLDATERKVHCICCLFEFKGYLCRHALAVLQASSVLEIPQYYILKRWTKDAKTIQILNVPFNVQDECSGSITQRFNDICVRCIKLAQEASLSKKSYDVALRALQEALEKVVYENNNTQNIDQNYNPHTSGYYRASEGNQVNDPRNPMLVVPNQLGTMFVVCDPKVFQAAGVPNKRIKCGADKTADKMEKHNFGFGTPCEHKHVNGCTKVHVSSGVSRMIDGCRTEKPVESMEQLD